MLEVTEQRPMNNEYVNSWIRQTVIHDLAGIFKLYRKFLSALQTRNHEVSRQMFYSARFSLEWQKQEFSKNYFINNYMIFWLKIKYSVLNSGDFAPCTLQL